jgi:hypothetical protein
MLRDLCGTALSSRRPRESGKLSGGSDRETSMSFLNCFDGAPDRFEPHDERKKVRLCFRFFCARRLSDDPAGKAVRWFSQEEKNNEVHLFGIHELTHMRWSRTASFWVSAERTIRCRHSACPAAFSPSAPHGSRCRLIRFEYGQEPVLVPFWEARRSLLRWHEPRFTRSLSTVFLWLRTNSWKMRSHSPEFLFEMGSGC